MANAPAAHHRHAPGKSCANQRKGRPTSSVLGDSRESPPHANFTSTAPRSFLNPTPLHQNPREILSRSSHGNHSSESPILRLLALVSKGWSRVVGKPCRTIFAAAHEPPDSVEFAATSSSQKNFSAALLTRVDKMFADLCAKKTAYARPARKKRFLTSRTYT